MPHPPLSCRSCAAPVTRSVADLGLQPGANHYVRPERAHEGERFFPLHAFVCDACGLVQLGAFHSPAELFGDYAYFSSISPSWLAHARAYAQAMQERFGLGPRSQVIEIASNDGYLLRWFAEAGVPTLGIEPAANVAKAAEALGVRSRVAFFGRAEAEAMAKEGIAADLIAANNVIAHVPDLNDFVAGVPLILKPAGVWTIEAPHLLNLIAETQFDTIYHEHFSYFSLGSLTRVLARHGLSVFDVETLPTHGGSLRVFACHAAALGSEGRSLSPRVAALLAQEQAVGLGEGATYDGFAGQVQRVKRDLLAHLIEAKRAGRRVVAYGAPAKGNTLLNYCGIGTDFLDYTVDLSPHKQGLLLPGSRLPIHPTDRIFADRPDEILILPWNLKEEIMAQMAGVRAWGCRFIVAVPRLMVLP